MTQENLQDEVALRNVNVTLFDDKTRLKTRKKKNTTIQLDMSVKPFRFSDLDYSNSVFDGA